MPGLLVLAQEEPASGQGEPPESAQAVASWVPRAPVLVQQVLPEPERVALAPVQEPLALVQGPLVLVQGPLVPVQGPLVPEPV